MYMSAAPPHLPLPNILFQNPDLPFVGPPAMHSVLHCPIRSKGTNSYLLLHAPLIQTLMCMEWGK
jgi:hypothetical protein